MSLHLRAKSNPYGGLRQYLAELISCVFLSLIPLQSSRPPCHACFCLRTLHWLLPLSVIPFSAAFRFLAQMLHQGGFHGHPMVNCSSPTPLFIHRSISGSQGVILDQQLHHHLGNLIKMQILVLFHSWIC